MGTDIHCGCERRNPKTGVWKFVNENVFPSCYDREELTVEVFDGRNYDLFGILADVRNGRGFAGCLTGDYFNIISEPKGLPEDMDPDTEEILSGQHTPSWLSLKEILDFDWTQKHRSCGYTSLDEYAKILKGEMPSWSCGGFGGPGIKEVSEKEAKKLLKNPSLQEKDVRYYVFCYFPTETYAECVSFFYNQTIPALKKLIPEGGTAEDVRIVFDFDS